ncbi:aspartate kinase [Phototrophicus methaneseepsis]|uniref:Aspartokinase n=1 Tax=Phototrophicus methaneseepsis TaxID=2710758 RepID=A0A7S8ICY1_9CHLR|nr:aspartate kinase [Phototrophicus methaneseepsis]QPC80789.1 aspartate kinase [Phototrophicus methaneseepsis]
MGTLVMKFGGSTLGTPAALAQVLSIILHEEKQWDHLVVVVSALDGVTDMMLEAAQLAQIGSARGYRRIAATIRTRHLALVENLPLGNLESTALQADIDRLLFEMLDTCQQVSNTPSDTLSPEISDAVAGVGEKLSARIIAAMLRHNDVRSVAIDGTDIIVTDSTYGNANPIQDKTCERIEQNLMPMLSRKIVPVVTGFIGVTETGKATTMGRGGSDYTASILSLCVDAKEVWIWSDVDGMMSADPREIESARIIPELAYEEVSELAYFGARILHARMIKPLRDHSIALRIKNVYKPQHPGTHIHANADSSTNTIKAVTSIHGFIITTGRHEAVYELIEQVHQVLYQASGSHMDTMLVSQSSSHTMVCFVVPTSVGIEATGSLNQIVDDALASVEGEDWDVSPVRIVTAIGKNMDTHNEMTARIFQRLSDLRLLGVAQGPSGCSLSLVLLPNESKQALERIHELVLEH